MNCPLYVALCLKGWRKASIKFPHPAEVANLELHLKDMADCHHSDGYLAVYQSLEALREDFPESEHLTLQDVKFLEGGQSREIRFSIPLQAGCKTGEVNNPESTKGPGEPKK